MNALHLILLRLLALPALAVERHRDERGDVPGWVLVTVMTAGLVGIIWRLAEDQLQAMLADALNSVTG